MNKLSTCCRLHYFLSWILHTTNCFQPSGSILAHLHLPFSFSFSLYVFWKFLPLLVRISTVAYFKIHIHSIQSGTTYIWNQKTVWPLLKHLLLQEIKILLLRCFILNGLQPLVQMLTLTLQPTTYTSYTMSPDMTQTHLYTVCTMHCRLKCQETLQERPQKTSRTCFAVFFFSLTVCYIL